MTEPLCPAEITADDDVVGGAEAAVRLQSIRAVPQLKKGLRNFP